MLIERTICMITHNFPGFQSILYGYLGYVGVFDCIFTYASAFASVVLWGGLRGAGVLSFCVII